MNLLSGRCAVVIAAVWVTGTAQVLAAGASPHRPPADPAHPEAARTTPEPRCLLDYGGSSGLLVNVADLIEAAEAGGTPAAIPHDLATRLPRNIHFRGRHETYTGKYDFATLDGSLFVRERSEPAQDLAHRPWLQMPLPDCLEGNVSEISADGRVLLALDQNRWIYTLNLDRIESGRYGWTRRWGPFFWSDFGLQMPEDAVDWAASELTPQDDVTFTDGAGREQTPFGILTVYVLRDDALRITYLDPWLPSDESREVCGPERGTRYLAGLSGSGSTVMVIGRDGAIYTRLYEFDVSGANSVFFDYSWQDQDGVENPLVQLPPPAWVRHPRVPGRVTSRISLRKLSPGTRHRVMRVEGTDELGNVGYWEKDLAERSAADWRFVYTGARLAGEPLPAAGYWSAPPEDMHFAGIIDGHQAEVRDFNPHCSPSWLRLDFGRGKPLKLVLHKTDGLRQERRARGVDAEPRLYRGAIEVPRNIWNRLDRQPAVIRAFIQRHFGDQRFLVGPLAATDQAFRFDRTCWVLRRQDPVAAQAPLRQTPPDMGVKVAEVMAAQEESRPPSAWVLANEFAPIDACP